jgi:prolyl-tRNA editing enzyme YbaK/EbsC (Cys-tRNA(Pro) deacylase)
VAWPEEVERVAQVLRDAAVDARIEELSRPTRTAAEAAAALGCEQAQVVKSLVFVCDEAALLVLVPGDRRADSFKLARATGASATRIATAEEVVAATGCEPGGVPPFAHPAPLRVLFERRLLHADAVWVGAGSERHMARLAPFDLVRLARAEEADMVR